MDAPRPPVRPPTPSAVVLGRFQPFHRGHATLIRAAIQAHPAVRIAIGSAQTDPGPDDPWTWPEREAMIRAWLDDEGLDAEIVAIPDLHDPPRYVEHAEAWHGEAGTLVTSDDATAELYRTSGWSVDLVDLVERERLQGWRIRRTALMLSTVLEEEGVRAALEASIPSAVVQWLMQEDRLHRLSTLGPGFPPVG